MGLDFSGSDAHWGYGSFHRFRCRLAQEIGIDLDHMEGFDGNLPWKNIIDPIVPFLNHSDCEGILTAKECSQIASRLRRLTENWEESDIDRRQALMLAVSMEECTSQNKDLVFC